MLLNHSLVDVLLELFPELSNLPLFGFIQRFLQFLIQNVIHVDLVWLLKYRIIGFLDHNCHLVLRYFMLNFWLLITILRRLPPCFSSQVNFVCELLVLKWIVQSIIICLAGLPVIIKKPVSRLYQI